MITDGDVVTKNMTKEKWVKTRDKVQWLGLHTGLQDKFMQDHLPEYDNDLVSIDKNLIHFKTTKKMIGFVVYVAQTYTLLVPYLKGIYLTLNSWKKSQYTGGWENSEG